MESNPADLLSPDQERALRENLIEPFPTIAAQAEDEINFTESDTEDAESELKPVGRWLSVRELRELRGEEVDDLEDDALPIQEKADDCAFIPVVESGVLPIVGAPPKPYADYNLARTTFATNELFDPLRAKMKEVFNDLCIEVDLSRDHFFQCRVEVRGTVLYFDITILLDPVDQGAVKNLVEVRHMMGCRFKFGEFAEFLAKNLNVVYLGGGGRPIPFQPPPLPPGFFPEIELSPEDVKMNALAAIAETLQMMDATTKDDEVIHGLQNTYYYNDLAHFGPGGIAIPLAERAVEIFHTAPPEELDIRCAAMATLAKIAAYPDLDPTLQIRILHVVLGGLHDPSLLIKMNALKALTGIVNSVDQLEHHKNREGVDFFLNMREVQFLLAQEVFSVSRPCIEMARKLCERN